MERDCKKKTSGETSTYNVQLKESVSTITIQESWDSTSSLKRSRAGNTHTHTINHTTQCERKEKGVLHTQSRPLSKGIAWLQQENNNHQAYTRRKLANTRLHEGFTRLDTSKATPKCLGNEEGKGSFYRWGEVLGKACMSDTSHLGYLTQCVTLKIRLQFFFFFERCLF